MSKRRQVRERVLQALYAQHVSGDDADLVLDRLVRPPFDDDATTGRFAEKLFLRSLDVGDEADALLSEHVRNWEIGRLALTDRMVVRMAVAEFLHFPDIPPKVTINEALELAKAFSTEKSGAFVNGVLDAILGFLREQGRLNKAGRGLVEASLNTGRKPRKAAPTDDASDD